MFTPQDIQEIEKTLKAFPVGSQISVAKVEHGDVSYHGIIKSKNKIITIDNQHAIFEVGSITKLFTSTVLAQMSLEKIISLDDAIDEELGFTLKNNATISYKELATHSSGLPGLPLKLIWSAIFNSKTNPYKDYSEDKLLDYLKNNLKLKKKGKQKYSNLGVGLLGYLLTKIANKSYQELLKQRIFIPLEMFESTTIKTEVKQNLVIGLNKKGKPTNNWDFDALAGAGAVLSSTYDLSKFVLANLEGKDAAFNLQQQCFYKKAKNRMGLGWFILKKTLKNIDVAYFHNGGTGGYRSSMVVNFEKNTGIVVLSNISGLYAIKGGKIDNLAFSLLENMT